MFYIYRQDDLTGVPDYVDGPFETEDRADEECDIYNISKSGHYVLYRGEE